MGRTVSFCFPVFMTISPELISSISRRSGSLIIIISENTGGIFVTPKLKRPLHISPMSLIRKYGHVTDTLRRESANRMQAFIENM